MADDTPDGAEALGAAHEVDDHYDEKDDDQHATGLGARAFEGLALSSHNAHSTTNRQVVSFGTDDPTLVARRKGVSS